MIPEVRAVPADLDPDDSTARASDFPGRGPRSVPRDGGRMIT
ncbi:hypothetical protein [Nocardioides euryhalodurans]|nr:hypothetical protein [Nocardioides euryhalodurans]